MRSRIIRSFWLRGYPGGGCQSKYSFVSSLRQLARAGEEGLVYIAVSYGVRGETSKG